MWGKSKERIFIENSRENTKYMDVFCVLGILSLEDREIERGKETFCERLRSLFFSRYI